jgi:hypothetical protein
MMPPTRSPPSGLGRDHPHARALAVDGSPAAALARLHATHLGPAYARLADAARTGQDAYSLAHNGAPFWTRLSADAACEQMFARAMLMGDGLVSTRLLKGARDWGRAACIVDVGGAHGSLLARLLDIIGNPNMRGVLFDQPAVVEAARAAWAADGAAGQGRGQVSFVGGNLF